jgi:hypothetical protein
MYNSIFYVVCCELSCVESGNIKKNLYKCPECKTILVQLTLDILNKYFCPSGKKCQSLHQKMGGTCELIHPTKKHQSPPYISPCVNGIHCTNNSCVCLHPNKKCILWTFRI